MSTFFFVRYTGVSENLQRGRIYTCTKWVGWGGSNYWRISERWINTKGKDMNGTFFEEKNGVVISKREERFQFETRYVPDELFEL